VHAVGVHIFRSGLFRYRYMFQYKHMQYITGTLPSCRITGTFGMFFVSQKLMHSRCPMYHCMDSLSGTSDRTKKKLLLFRSSGLRSLGASKNSEAFREQQGPAELAVINFNNKSYSRWTKARDAYRSVCRNARVNSVWKMVYAERDDADDDNKPFQLKCKNYNVNCQLKAPSTWKRYQKCKKTAPRSIGSVSARCAVHFFPNSLQGSSALQSLINDA
jgi:hypothetical protein